MQQTATTCLHSLPKDNDVQFNRSILSGVEIKRCKGNPADYKSHVHYELSLGYILAGSSDLTLRDTTLRISAGNGVIIPPLTSHRCMPRDVANWEYVMLFIDPALYADKLQFINPQRLTGDTARKLSTFISQLVSESNPTMLESILSELLLEYGEALSPDTADMGTIDRVRDYLAAHVEESISLSQLETLSGLNKFTLIRLFKKAYVTTPANFHLQCRVAEAKTRLHRDCDVLALCHDLQFYDQAHFIHEFKRMYGITPAAYLAQLNV